MTAYYNEFDPFAAQWLRELIQAGMIAPGVVDSRSISDVRQDDLAGFRQCHFFAGIGVWSYALRQAGWPDDRPVWTGSCPCQPFSNAGKSAGFADSRHLWPTWFALIEARRPECIIGEQVSSADALPWIDLVRDNLEDEGYTVGCLDTCAAGVGAPHIRQRMYWVGHAVSARLEGHAGNGNGEERRPEPAGSVAETSVHVGMADYIVQQRSDRKPGVGYEHDAGGRIEGNGVAERGVQIERPGPTNGFWRAADWIGCTDGKWRPVEPGIAPLAHGATARVGRLRGYGNAINAEQAAAFIEAVMEEA